MKILNLVKLKFPLKIHIFVNIEFLDLRVLGFQIHFFGESIIQGFLTVCVKKDVPQFDLFFCSKKQTQFCSSF